MQYLLCHFGWNFSRCYLNMVSKLPTHSEFSGFFLYIGYNIIYKPIYIVFYLFFTHEIVNLKRKHVKALTFPFIHFSFLQTPGYHFSTYLLDHNTSFEHVCENNPISTWILKCTVKGKMIHKVFSLKDTLCASTT